MTNVVCLSAGRRRAEHAPRANPLGPVLVTLHLVHPIPVERSAPISIVELRDPLAGAAAEAAAIKRGSDTVGCAIAALLAMSSLSPDNVEDMDLTDLGHALSSVAVLLVMSA